MLKLHAINLRNTWKSISESFTLNNNQQLPILPIINDEDDIEEEEVITIDDDTDN